MKPSSFTYADFDKVDDHPFSKAGAHYRTLPVSGKRVIRVINARYSRPPPLSLPIFVDINVKVFFWFSRRLLGLYGVEQTSTFRRRLRTRGQPPPLCGNKK